MTEERKISDVVLEIEATINSMNKTIQNLKLTNDIILNHINKLIKDFKTAPVNQFAPTNHPIKKENHDVIVAQPLDAQIDEYGQYELSEEIIPKGQRRTDRAKLLNNNVPEKKVQVSQLVMSEGKPVFLANVEIFKPGEKKPELIKQARTNAKGRWVASLDPGEYIVHLQKKSDGKILVELRYNIMIPNSDKPLELPSAGNTLQQE